MSSRSTWIKLTTDAVIGFGALFLVGVLLAAIPNHRVAVSSDVSAGSAQALQQEQAPAAGTDHSTMPGMNMEDSARKSTEQDAMQDMANMDHGDSLHMHMTESRPQAPGDLQRAEEIAKQLRAGIEKYK